MKKRCLPLHLALALLLAFTACSPAPAGEQTPPAAGTKERALNVIDDHYRNYYEIFVASFYDSDGDGTGDLNGVLEKLDYLNDGDGATDTDLGFNGIWLMPVMPSPSYHKYDVTDFCAIDPAYGTLADFQALLDACHARGIRLIIDFPFNHTSAQHPWFLEALAYYESLAPGEPPDYDACPYAGYYHFESAPANADWYCAGESAWYYEGKFWEQMPDLALENTLVRREIEQAASFFLEMGVDGFRLDAVKEYFSGSPKANLEVLSWFNAYALSVNPDAIIIGEAWEPVRASLSAYYESGVESFFDFPIAQATGSVAAAIRSGSAEALSILLTQGADAYRAVNPAYIDAPFLSNHDTSRISAHYGGDLRKMKLAAGLLLTMEGSPFVYYGEELGMNSSGAKDENKRLPMHWSDMDGTGTPLPPAGADEVAQKFPALDAQRDDPSSLYNYYKRALRLRNQTPGLARGAAQAVEALTTGAICAVSKTYGAETLLIVYNIGGEAASLPLTGTAYASCELWGSLIVDNAPVTFADGTLALPSYAIALLGR